MQLFTNLCFGVTILTSLYLIYFLKSKDFAKVKPSIWFLSFFHVQIQWAAAIYSGEIYGRIDHPYHFFVLTQVFPLVTLLLSSILFQKPAANVYNKISKTNKFLRNEVYLDALKVLLPVCAGIIGVYLIYVPFKSTGFYQNIFGEDILSAIIAREESLKTLSAVWLKYLFQFFARFLGMFSVIMLGILLVRRLKIKYIVGNLFILLAIGGIVIGAMLPGSRAGGVLVVFSMLAGIFFYKNLKFQPTKILAIIALVIFPAVITQLQKYNMDVSMENIGITTEIIGKRALYVPMEGGIWWIEYVDDNGYWGVKGVHILSKILGTDFVHVPNFIMQNKFNFKSSTTGFATVSFVYSYYCYFGLIAVPFMIFGILILDFWLLLHQSIRAEFVLPAICTLNMACINLVGSDYLTMFLTYGYFTGAVFILFFSILSRYKIKL